MTNDELKKEAEEYVKQNYCEMCIMADDCKCGCIDCFTVQAYLAGAEPREKRIEELKETCNKWFEHLKNREEELLNELNNQNAKYNKQIEELEAQIEKMKNCKNCKKLKKEKDGLLFCTVGSFYTNAFGKNCDKWEIKENEK